MHSALPESVENQPSGQWAQASMYLLPSNTLKVPAGQFVHADRAAARLLGLYVPFGQGVDTFEPAGQKVPRSQTEHLSLSKSVAYHPPGQSVHASSFSPVSTGLNVPGGHGLPSIDPSGHHLPFPHTSPMTCEPLDAQNRPAAHGAQEANDVPFLWRLNRPAGHSFGLEGPRASYSGASSPAPSSPAW